MQRQVEDAVRQLLIAYGEDIIISIKSEVIERAQKR